jgi:hypothetical protein
MEQGDAFPPEPIATAALRATEVPPPGAPWWPDVSAFALTFNGYVYLGGLRACAAVSELVRDRHLASARLVGGLGLNLLRVCLFFEQRCNREVEEIEDPALRAYVDALLEKIAARAGSSPVRAGYGVERRAFEVIWAEELASGRHPRRLSQKEQRIEGCDILSYPDAAHGGEPERIEVKGWGEPFLDLVGAFRYGAEVNREQYERAHGGAGWRLEVVANLAGDIPRPIERLSLSAAEVARVAEPWKYTVPLSGFEAGIIRHDDSGEPEQGRFGEPQANAVSGTPSDQPPSIQPFT